MTFCRPGNDYADVAQPFRLTGSSHGGGGDTAAVATPTGEGHAPPFSAPPTSLLVLSVAFSRMVEGVMEEQEAEDAAELKHQKDKTSSRISSMIDLNLKVFLFQFMQRCISLLQLHLHLLRHFIQHADDLHNIQTQNNISTLCKHHLKIHP